MKEQILQSFDKSPLQLYIWDDVRKPLGVIQLAHGSYEHAQRYKTFASNLNDIGWIVVANDHRGHGNTSKLQNTNLGYLNGDWETLIKDLKSVNDFIKEKYDLPVVMFGHSMGSFLALSYFLNYEETLEKLILSGFTWYSRLSLSFSMTLIEEEINICGKDFISQKVYSLLNRRLNNKFQNEGTTGFEWLNTDIKNRENFNNDPNCGFILSCNYFYEMFSGLKYNQKNIKKINKDKKILLIAGKNDPIGGFGKNIKRGYKNIKKYNKNTTIKLYKDCRHEVLFDNKRYEVLVDIIDFLD